MEFCYHIFTGNISEAGLQHWHFIEKNGFFSKNPVCGAHGIVFSWSWEAFLVFDRKPLLYIVFQNLPLTETRKTVVWKFHLKQMRKESSVLVKLQAVQREQEVLL